MNTALRFIENHQIYQFAKLLMVRNHGFPERELCAAILFQAVCDILINAYTTKHDNTGTNRGVMYDDARLWFLTPSDWTFSFSNVCHILDINPGRLRNLLISSNCLPGGELDGKHMVG
jgi:hypothetical protein